MGRDVINLQPDVPFSFYILAVIMVGSAIAAMSLRNLVHCALCLAASFIAMAGLFLQLNAPFAAFAQILVYVGAVAILIVFAILLTRNSEEQPQKRTRALIPSLGITILLGGTLVTMIVGSSRFNWPASEFNPSVSGLGKLLMTTYLVPLQIIGVLLTAALIGAIIIALQDPDEAKGGEQ